MSVSEQQLAEWEALDRMPVRAHHALLAEVRRLRGLGLKSLEDQVGDQAQHITELRTLLARTMGDTPESPYWPEGTTTLYDEIEATLEKESTP